jgi:hypothetical protein
MNIFAMLILEVKRMLNRLVYISEPQFDPARGSSLSQLSQIMATSQRHNQAAGVTGALVYDEAWFLQVLEGERRAICQTFSRINEDERHANCLLVEMTEVATRSFANWWMGLATRDATTASAFAPYLKHGTLQAESMSARDKLDLIVAVSKLGLRRDVRVVA